MGRDWGAREAFDFGLVDAEALAPPLGLETPSLEHPAEDCALPSHRRPAARLLRRLRRRVRLFLGSGRRRLGSVLGRLLLDGGRGFGAAESPEQSPFRFGRHRRLQVGAHTHAACAPPTELFLLGRRLLALEVRLLDRATLDPGARLGKGIQSPILHARCHPQRRRLRVLARHRRRSRAASFVTGGAGVGAGAIFELVAAAVIIVVLARRPVRLAVHATSLHRQLLFGPLARGALTRGAAGGG